MNNLLPKDDVTIRCPRLGHQICFSFCRSENRGLPCSRALDCWFEHFPVEEHLRGELRPEEWQQVFGGFAKPKLVSLVEMIREAQQVKK
jgi:hypothetical protein